ncbi:MAG: Crp/Fnr family transcriptional regulator [Pseudomonadota bacterium]
MANPTIHELLKKNPFFSQMPDGFIEYLADHARGRKLERGDAVFRQGDPAKHFYLLLKGEVNVEVPAITGPALVIQNLGPGQVLGWSWLISPYEWDFQAHAESDAEVLEFDGATVLAHCEADQSFGYQLLKRFTELMSERLHAARRRMMDQWNPVGFA